MMIDNEYNCDWYIDNTKTNIKSFPSGDLKNVKKFNTTSFWGFYWEHGLLSLLWKDYDIYFMSGETRNLSLFLFCLLKYIFFKKKKRIYFWSHGYYGKESWMELLFWKRPLFKLPDGVFTYGNYAKKIMVDDGFDEKCLFPIHNSLDYDTQLVLRKSMKSSDIYKKHFGDTNPILLFIGRLTPVKRLDMLVESISLLKNKGLKYNLVIVGDGKERLALEKLVINKNIQSQVWFYGECYEETENAKLIYNADLCVAPGNVGLTSIHSMMFGCPVVSHNCFSLQMPEFEAIKEGKTGSFFEYNNVINLSEVISNWFDRNEGHREAVRKNCYEEVDTQWTPYYQMDVIRKHLVR